MNKAVFKLTRELAVIFSGMETIVLLNQDYFMRGMMNLFLLILFLTTSHLFEKRYQKISVSYIYVFIVVFIINSLTASAFTPTMIDQMNADKTFGHWIGDYYELYFWTVLIVYAVVMFYLRFSPAPEPAEAEPEEDFSPLHSNNCLVGCILLIGIYAVVHIYEAIIPVFAYLVHQLVYDKKHPKGKYIFVMLIAAAVGREAFTQRFKFVQIMLPIFFIFLIKNKSQKKVNIFKVNVCAMIGVLIGCLYGVVSEVYKLNHDYNGQYRIQDIITNTEMLFTFFYRQFYRVFAIWIKLGGYIIYHTQVNGFYYGITYIKPFAGIFGFQYVSLPIIAAWYDQASYAQPGLLAEGYANFGVIGAALNLLAVFFFMEYTWNKYRRKPSIINLLFAVVPFSQILLDGGTLNSAIYLFALSMFVNIINIIGEQRSRNHVKISENNNI